MSRHRYRLLVVATHPVQYAAPVFRRMAAHPRLDLLVAYCSLAGAEPALDPGFGVPVHWDVPLLDGYPWVHVPNVSPRPRVGSFFGLVNPGLWRLIRRGGFDAVVLYTGYTCVSFWVALAAARLSGSAVLFGTDGASLASRSGRRWIAAAKRMVWPHLFRLPDVALVASTGGVQLLRSLGIPNHRIACTLDVVDNDWWTARAAEVAPMALRQRCGIPESAFVVLFAGKLAPWKRPQDVLSAVARAKAAAIWVVYAGDGAMRPAP